jgi:periplasmic divalent cation tolerance protein
LVAERLAACVNILPGVTSVYRWQGDIEEDTEDTLLIKTRTDGVSALSDRIRELHSYDTPEIVVLEVDAAASDPRYVAWVCESTGAAA